MKGRQILRPVGWLGLWKPPRALTAKPTSDPLPQIAQHPAQGPAVAAPALGAEFLAAHGFTATGFQGVRLNISDWWPTGAAGDGTAAGAASLYS